jgi:3-hydroxybutyryl-CoA dehydratase
VVEIKDFYVGQFYEKNFIVSEEAGMEFAKISEDYNPIHLNSEVASKSRFGKKIVHGMLIGSYFSGIIGNKFPGAGSVYISQEIFFKRPVYYGSEVTIRVEISDVNLERKRIGLKTQCFDKDRSLLVDGNAKILFE